MLYNNNDNNILEEKNTIKIINNINNIIINDNKNKPINNGMIININNKYFQIKDLKKKNKQILKRVNKKKKNQSLNLNQILKKLLEIKIIEN